MMESTEYVHTGTNASDSQMKQKTIVGYPDLREVRSLAARDSKFSRSSSSSFSGPSAANALIIRFNTFKNVDQS